MLKLKRFFGTAVLCIACTGLHQLARADASPTAATQELTGINSEFERELIEVADNVHVAIGYGASTFSFIEGEDGIIMIDAGQLETASEDALKAYRKISRKPIVAIILTHSHGDHVNGAAPFIAAAINQVPVWGHDSFGEESSHFHTTGITINRQRGLRQAGFKLPPEQRINNGIAPAVYPTGPDAFNPADALRPNRTFKDQTELEISGIRLSLVANAGETADQIYIWYRDKGIVFAGDNFYKSWPNLYAIRGTPYRDVKAWAAAIEMLRPLNAGALVGGHTRPILGHRAVQDALTIYRDGILHVFDKSIEGINLGLPPNELVEFAKLPPELANNRLLRPYYGHPDWAVRSIFTGYLGWFDGNPSSLFPLSVKAEAAKIVTLAGGMRKMKRNLKKAIGHSDNQWASQLADYILALEPQNAWAMRLKAKALTGLAADQITATARNYYLTSAQELREKAQSLRKNKRQ